MIGMSLLCCPFSFIWGSHTTLWCLLACSLALDRRSAYLRAGTRWITGQERHPSFRLDALGLDSQFLLAQTLTIQTESLWTLFYFKLKLPQFVSNCWWRNEAFFPMANSLQFMGRCDLPWFCSRSPKCNTKKADDGAWERNFGQLGWNP